MNYRLRTQADYNKAINVVKRVIHEWDPCEIERIVAQIRHIQSENDTIDVISSVFGSSFEEEHFNREQCHEVGILLFKIF